MSEHNLSLWPVLHNRLDIILVGVCSKHNSANTKAYNNHHMQYIPTLQVLKKLDVKKVGYQRELCLYFL